MHDRSQNRISAINSPHELALGIVFGLIVGLMPKDSAIPWALAVLFLLTRANLLCGIFAAIAVSLASPHLDGIFDRLGYAVLSIEFLRSTFTSWMELPWIAWTRFNNTVVAGSFSFGLIVSLPTYLLGQVFFRLWGIPLIERVMQNRFVQLLFGETDEQNAADEIAEPSLTIET